VRGQIGRRDVRYAADPANPADAPGRVLCSELALGTVYDSGIGVGLVRGDVTGAQLDDLLESQWQQAAGDPGTDPLRRVGDGGRPPGAAAQAPVRTRVTESLRWQTRCQLSHLAHGAKRRGYPESVCGRRRPDVDTWHGGALAGYPKTDQMHWQGEVTRGGDGSPP
jgi:hypothetical protein